MISGLVVSHLATFTAGAGGMYLLTQLRPSGALMHLDKTKVARAADRWVYIAAVLSIVIAACATVYSVLDSRQQQDCFNEYANELASSLEPRQAASEARTAAQVEWQTAVSHTLVAAEQILAAEATDMTALTVALAEFRAADSRLDAAEGRLAEERIENPYPKAPREVC